MNQAFLSHFKISSQEAETLCSLVQEGQSFLEVCLEKKAVDENSYLKWAKDYYGLALLKEEFLATHNQVQTLLNRYKNVFPKNVVPFYEWDGVIYVMCLEPLEFKAPQSIHYVLAPHYLLQKFAMLNESKVQGIKEAEMPTLTSEVTNPLFKNLNTPSASVETPNFNFTLPDNIADSAAAPAGMEIPEGMDLKETSILNLANLDAPAEEAPVEAPAGLDFPPLPQEKPEIAVEHKITSEELKDTPTKIFDIPLPGKNVQAPKATPVAAVPVASLPEVQAPTNLAPLKTAPVDAGQFQPVLEQMKKFFTQSMVLSFKNNILAPYKYDTTWSKDSHSQAAIDISSPSIFRIVCETLKPYHGYVIPNSINDSFFTTWNQGTYPEHITLYPVIANKQLVGMILGTTTKANSKSFQLHHVEAIADTCAACFNKELSKAA